MREKLVRPCHVRAVGGAGLPTGLLDLPGVLFKTGRAPLTYLVFDLLCLDGFDMMPLRYRERRRILEELELDGPCCSVPEAFEDGAALLEAV